MSKKITLLCALLGLVLFLAPAYAEVQNIKVSGDIEAKAIYRNNYDMEDARTVTNINPLWNAEDEDSLLMSVIRLQVDADLTDNVAAKVRLANLRDWDSVGTEAEDIVIDLASITLREMLYSPLTVTIGRQELMFGNGLIIGKGLYLDPNNTAACPDLSPLHGFDAVRATLDYNPWILDLVASKMIEADDDSSQTRDNDRDLYGVNLGYKFGKYDAEMEGYLFYKRDPQYNLVIAGDIAGSPSAGRTFELSRTYTLGLRGSLIPLENLILNGEVAGQLGDIVDSHAGPDDRPLDRDRGALAVNVAGEYKLANVRFTPILGAEYLYLSGEEYAQKGDFEQWEPIYRGKVMGSIRDYLENLYTTNDPYDTSGLTNQHTVKVKGGVDLGELVDGLSLDLAYLHYWFAEEPVVGLEDEVGDEIDMKVNYNYTDDVQFALDGAWFFAGNYYDKQLHNTKNMPMSGGIVRTNSVTGRVANDDVVSLIGSCKVTF